MSDEFNGYGVFINDTVSVGLDHDADAGQGTHIYVTDATAPHTMKLDIESAIKLRIAILAALRHAGYEMPDKGRYPRWQSVHRGGVLMTRPIQLIASDTRFTAGEELRRGTLVRADKVDGKPELTLFAAKINQPVIGVLLSDYSAGDDIPFLAIRGIE